MQMVRCRKEMSLIFKMITLKAMSSRRLMVWMLKIQIVLYH